MAQPDTHLGGPWLTLARLAWIALVAAGLALFALSIPVRYEQLHTLSGPAGLPWGGTAEAFRANLAQLGLSVDFYAIYQVAVEVIFALAFCTIPLIIFWLKSDDWLAMMVSFGLVMFGITGITPIILGGVASQRGWLWLINFAMFLNVLGAGALLLGWYFFPDGRFIPGWTRWLAFAFAAWTVVILITGGTGSWSFLTHFWASAGWYSTGALAQIYRYIRVSSPIQQQQTKWVVFGSTLAFFAFVVRTLPIVLAPSLFKPGIFSLLYTLLTRPLMYLFMLLIPLSIGISILRYRLWDIDILIRRTLIYGVLTAALALIYFGGVVMLQVGFRALTGQTSQLAIVASTLTITALFSPLRGRVQMTIDRRFYRHKYNAAQALAAFSATVRDEVDLNRLTGQLLALVEETMRPAHVSLWLCKAAGLGQQTANMKQLRQASGKDALQEET